VERYVILVDAGYLLSAAGWACVGVERRAELDADCAGLVGWLQNEGERALPAQELLRLYWYDAALNRAQTPEQRRVAELPDTKVRVGQLNWRGDQKGVDAMVLSDLSSLARGHLITDAVLVSGDGDFVEGVSEAQRDGVRVHVWGVRTPRSTVSPDLRREADRFVLLEPELLAEFFRRATVPEPTGPSSLEGAPTSDISRPLTPQGARSVATPAAVPVWASMDPEDAKTSGSQFARQWAGQVSASEVAAMLASRPTVKGDVHFRLLRFTLDSANLPWGARLPYDTAEAMRAGFWEALTNIAQEMSPT
jgi:uncharacterized LabA/DUF88 family protein